MNAYLKRHISTYFVFGTSDHGLGGDAPDVVVCLLHQGIKSLNQSSHRFQVAGVLWAKRDYLVALFGNLRVTHRVVCRLFLGVAGIELDGNPLVVPILKGHERDEVRAASVRNANRRLRQNHGELAVLHEFKIHVKEPSFGIGLTECSDSRPQWARSLSICPSAGYVALGMLSPNIVGLLRRTAPVRKNSLIHYNASESAIVVTAPKLSAGLIDKAPNRIWLSPRRIGEFRRSRMQPQSFVAIVADIERQRKLRPLGRRLEIISEAAAA